MLRRDHVFQLSWGRGERRKRCWDGLKHFFNQNSLPDNYIYISRGLGRRYTTS